MMKPSSDKRAKRRIAQARMKARARKLYPQDLKARLANNLAACSCHMCGNPSHYGEVSMQKLRADGHMRDAVRDLTN
jgi:hypothetical protein